MEQALLFFDFSKNIEQDVYHNGEQNSSKKAVTLLRGQEDLWFPCTSDNPLWFLCKG